MALLGHIFCDEIFVKIPLGIQTVSKFSHQRMQMIDILRKYILWREFLNDLDAQSDFDKHFVTKKLIK